MRTLWLLLACSIVIVCSLQGNSDTQDDDNEFAEFENFDEDEFESPPVKTKQEPEDKQKIKMADEAALNEAEYAEEEDDDATVQDDDDEFEHFKDDSEFEGFTESSNSGSNNGKETSGDGKTDEGLKISSIPLHFRTNWDSFYIEMLMCVGVLVYMLNFVIGKSRNSTIANMWYSMHSELLEDNFVVVGDNGTGDKPTHGELIKESEFLYSLYCSGRRNCSCMVITMRLLKRQDLISTISRMFKPTSDQVTIKVMMDDRSMDNYIFCLAKKKALNKLHKEMTDLNTYCNDKKSVSKYKISDQFSMLNEINEIASSVLDPMMVSAINRYEDNLEYIHFSDQYSGPKPQDDGTVPKQPETEKILTFCFNIGNKGRCDVSHIEQIKPLLKMVLHCIDACKNIRLTREGKAKSDKARQIVNNNYAKATHTQRSEEAQLRREKKRKEDQDRMMNETDPDKQRRLEEKNNKKDLRKKKSSIKMAKIKSM